VKRKALADTMQEASLHLRMLTHSHTEAHRHTRARRWKQASTVTFWKLFSYEDTVLWLLCNNLDLSIIPFAVEHELPFSNREAGS